jgi:membrane protease YdiL (CAAX protease family)
MTEGEMDEGDGSDSTERVPFVVFVVFEALIAPASLVLGWMVGQPPLADFAWEGRAALAGLLAALPMIALLLAALRWPVGPLGELKRFFDRDLAPALEGCHWSDLALISVVAGVGEEMLFRGVIQGGLTRLIGPVLAVATSSVLFGLIHTVSTAYVVAAGLLSAYLGAVWLATGNLLTVIVAHAVYDFVALVAMLRARDAEAGGD